MPYNTNSTKNIYLGFFYHYLAWTIPTMLGREIEILTAILCSIGWGYLIKGINNAHWKIRFPFHGWYRFLFFLYLIVTLIMIVRGYTIDYEYPWITFKGMINYHFFFPTYILPYLMPLIVFIPYKEHNFIRIVDYSIIASIIMLLCFFTQFRNIISSSLSGEMYGYKNMSIYVPFTFVILFYRYISFKQWIYNLLAFLCILFIAVVAARRGGSVTCSIILLIALFNWSACLSSQFKRNFVRILLFISLFGAIYVFNNSSLTAFIRERGMEDSRTGVDIALIEQMSDWQLIFGKGLNGRYFYPIIDGLSPWRYVSETGFYNLVLKGGYLLAILHIVVLLYPTLLGIFKSRNNLCKMLGAYVLVSLWELYPFGHLMFDFKFLIIWIGVVLCYNKHVRMMSDLEIKKLFFS